MSLHQLYDCNCSTCGGNIQKLSISETEEDDLQKSFNKVARWIYRQRKSDIEANDINESVVSPLISSINSVLQDGFNRGIDHTVPYIMQRELRENIYVFSGAKTYAELKELSERLLDANGNIKPFSKFWQEVQSVHSNYNRNYLEAEYLFATQSAQMASKWNEFESDGDRYNLQYRTANDDRVRDSHQLLHNTTLGLNDPFWNDFFPPNGWRCRCTVVQVRKSKYPESDSFISRLNGLKAIAIHGKDGENKGKIFKFNPGKDKVIFPKNHPYLSNLGKPEKETIVNNARSQFEKDERKEIVSIIQEIDNERKWFERGFNDLLITNKPTVNGSTDMNGRIWLKPDRMEKTISAINKLKKGEKITFEEADSISTFWHEIVHNRNKHGNMPMTRLQVRNMELANEFVARNTLHEFYGALGAKLQHPELVLNRVSTGYNSMVNNYQLIISKTGLNNDKVVGKVQEHLFNEKYTNQKEGLMKALEGAKKSDGTKLNKTEINSLVSRCDTYAPKYFTEYLDKIIR